MMDVVMDVMMDLRERAGIPAWPETSERIEAWDNLRVSRHTWIFSYEYPGDRQILKSVGLQVYQNQGDGRTWADLLVVNVNEEEEDWTEEAEISLQILGNQAIAEPRDQLVDLARRGHELVRQVGRVEGAAGYRCLHLTAEQFARRYLSSDDPAAVAARFQNGEPIEAPNGVRLVPLTWRKWGFYI